MLHSAPPHSNLSQCLVLLKLSSKGPYINPIIIEQKPEITHFLTFIFSHDFAVQSSYNFLNCHETIRIINILLNSLVVQSNKPGDTSKLEPIYKLIVVSFLSFKSGSTILLKYLINQIKSSNELHHLTLLLHASGRIMRACKDDERVSSLLKNVVDSIPKKFTNNYKSNWDILSALYTTISATQAEQIEREFFANRLSELSNFNLQSLRSSQNYIDSSTKILRECKRLVKSSHNSQEIFNIVEKVYQISMLILDNIASLSDRKCESLLKESIKSIFLLSSFGEPHWWFETWKVCLKILESSEAFFGISIKALILKLLLKNCVNSNDTTIRNWLLDTCKKTLNKNAKISSPNVLIQTCLYVVMILEDNSNIIMDLQQLYIPEYSHLLEVQNLKSKFGFYHPLSFQFDGSMHSLSIDPRTTPLEINVSEASPPPIQEESHKGEWKFAGHFSDLICLKLVQELEYHQNYFLSNGSINNIEAINFSIDSNHLPQVLDLILTIQNTPTTSSLPLTISSNSALSKRHPLFIELVESALNHPLLLLNELFRFIVFQASILEKQHFAASRIPTQFPQFVFSNQGDQLKKGGEQETANLKKRKEKVLALFDLMTELSNESEPNGSHGNLNENDALNSDTSIRSGEPPKKKRKRSKKGKSENQPPTATPSLDQPDARSFATIDKINAVSSSKKDKTSDSTKKTKKQSSKRTVCNLWLHHKCYKGNDCPFLHEGTQLTFDTICKFHRTGNCTKGDACPFSHNLKSEACNNLVTTQFCKFGEECFYSHDPSLVSRAKSNLEDQNKKLEIEKQKAAAEGSEGFLPFAQYLNPVSSIVNIHSISTETNSMEIDNRDHIMGNQPIAMFQPDAAGLTTSAWTNTNQ